MVSIATVIAISSDFLGLYAKSSPRAHEALARMANRLAVAVGWSPREGTEGVELTVVFPSNVPKDHYEALVATGVRTSLTIVFAQYTDREQVRFIFFFNGETATTSVMQFKEGTPHRLRIELGGMLPPATHPFWKNTPPAEIARRRSLVRFVIDGTELFTATGPQVEPADATPEIGAMPPHVIERRPFTGKIVEQRIIRAAAP